MTFTKRLLTSCLVLASVMFCANAVPISIDKTKVKIPEEAVKDPPQSVVSHQIFESIA